MYFIFIFNCILSAFYFMQITMTCFLLLVRHVASKGFNCAPKDSHLQWYFRKTIFKLWVEAGGGFDWRIGTERKYVPGAWVRAFKTKHRRRVLISSMCPWLCLRYEDRKLLDLCSELWYSSSWSLWQRIIPCPRSNRTLQCYPLVPVINQLSWQSPDIRNPHW